MPKNVKGFRWVKLTEVQYDLARDMCEPDTRSAKNQFEPVSYVTGWCVEQMAKIPLSLPRKYDAAPFEVKKQILELLDKS